jgi:hypothetical protein
MAKGHKATCIALIQAKKKVGYRPGDERRPRPLTQEVNLNLQSGPRR